MKVIYSAGNQLPKLPSMCCAIGIFDGVHIGHQWLLRQVIAKAKALSVKTAVVTFLPHPVHVLRPDLTLGYLISFAHRAQLLAKAGIDYCIVLSFTKPFAAIEPEKFIKNTLVGKLHAKAIFVGDDFRFGRDRRGDVALFKTLSSRYGYECLPVHPVRKGGAIVSSTRLRQLLPEGKLNLAAKLLGRPFSVLGEVVKGDGRGRTIGIPTANVEYSADVLPPVGVYAVHMKLGKRIFKGVANLGMRPTFDAAAPKAKLEVHLFNFKGDLYGKTVEVSFFKKIRSERRFPSTEALVRQIHLDIAKAKSVFI